VYFASPALFKGLICLISALALHEFYAMALPKRRRPEASIATALGVVMVVGLVFSESPTVKLAALSGTIIILLLLFLARVQEMSEVARDLSVAILGIVYIPLLLSYAGILRDAPHGREWIFLVLLIVMSSDTLAYFVGLNWGRHRLYYVVSPNKSIEGALGGLLGACLGALIARLSFFPELDGYDVLFLGLVMGGVSQLGDLVESLFKRSFGVKDSGSIIPGHGGLLDRLDSLILILPLAFYYAVWIF
jgi:phosphatidate cytidylyltransferase